MEEREYQGNISPIALAHALVATFNQPEQNVLAQQLGQGNQQLVQISLARHHGRRITTSFGVSIVPTEGRIVVSVGQANWLNAMLPASLIGAIIWPPLLLFPLARGIQTQELYQEIWQAIEDFCAQAGASQGAISAAYHIYCPHCGTANEEGSPTCKMCGAALAPAQAQAAPAALAPAAPPAPQPNTWPAAQRVICPTCGATVPAANFCGNCGAALLQTTGERRE